MLRKFITWLTGAFAATLEVSTMQPSSISEPAGAGQPRAATAPSPIRSDITVLPRALRLSAERCIAQKHFPTFDWSPRGSEVWLEGTIPTSVGRRYTLRVIIPAAFPFRPPMTFLLTQCDGVTPYLKQVSFQMHTLTPDAEGHTQLCLYNDQNWQPSLTLQHVLVKAGIWLEALEQHRRTGKPLTEYLSHV